MSGRDQLIALTVTGVVEPAGEPSRGQLMPGGLTDLAPGAPIIRVWGPAGSTPAVDSVIDHVEIQLISAGQGLPLAGNVDVASASGLMGLLAAMVVLVGGPMLAGTASLSVALRTTALGRLRLTGASPAQVRRVLLGESLVLSAVATPIGLALGALSAPLAILGLRQVGLVPASARPGLTPWPVLPALLVGLVLPVLATALAARSATSIGPLDAFRGAPAAHGRRGRVMRRILGVAVLAGAIGLGLASGTVPPDRAANLALVMAFGMIVAVILLGPDLSRVLMPVAGLLIGRFGPAGHVAGRSLRRDAGRTAALAQPVMVSVALAGVLFGTGSLLDASQRSLADRSVGVTGRDEAGALARHRGWI